MWVLRLRRMVIIRFRAGLVLVKFVFFLGIFLIVLAVRWLLVFVNALLVCLFKMGFANPSVLLVWFLPLLFPL